MGIVWWMPAQTTQRVLMIRPAAFGFNPETATSNTFQENRPIEGAAERAVIEFDRFVEDLCKAGVDVEVVQDTPDPVKPDAVFPNNWVSFHEGGSAVLYPMANPSRRAEVRPDIVERLGYQVALDLRDAEGLALEGTGSLVLDRVAKVAYACLSPRTSSALLERFSEALGYRLVPFRAVASGAEIYHTNVVMSVGQDIAILCLDAILDPTQVVQELESAGKTILPISADQMGRFAGNLLQLRGSDGLVWAMSKTACDAFTPDQLQKLSKESAYVVGDIPTIETLGGGSARCMIAELF